MSTVVHEIAPDGDVILVVKNPNAPFAPWTENSNASCDASEQAKPKPDVRIRVSSANLKAASPYFNRALSGNWKEATSLKKNGTVELEASDWDIGALLLLMRIVHYQLFDLPLKVSQEFLAKLCVLVDYYECPILLRFIAEKWYPQSHTLGTLCIKTDLRSRMIRLWLYWILGKPDNFRLETWSLITEFDSPLTSLGLPFPKSIVDEINKRREAAVGSILQIIQDQRLTLRDKGTGCGRVCGWCCYGALKDFVRANKIKVSSAPFEGISLGTLKASVSDIKVPKWRTWYEGRPPYGTVPGPHECKDTKFSDMIGKINSVTAKGLELAEFKPRPDADKPAVASIN